MDNDNTLASYGVRDRSELARHGGHGAQCGGHAKIGCSFAGQRGQRMRRVQYHVGKSGY